MKIISGLYKGRKLKAPPGRATRPTSAKVREALFSALGDLSGLAVVDLFCGSGALGLEALSRGAARVLLVDMAPAALAATKANLTALGCTDKAQVLRRDLKRGYGFLIDAGPWDLILADPPYDRGWGRRVLAGPLIQNLTKDGRLVLETSPAEAPEESPGWRIIRQKNYGQTYVTILCSEAQ